MNASASQRVATATAAADLGKCRSKRESTTSGGERAREGVSQSGEGTWNGGTGEGGGELQGENFVYLERRKEQKEARGNRTNAGLM